jgi:hypothetical protein
MRHEKQISLKDILSAVNRAMQEVGQDCLHPRYKKLKTSNDHYSFGLCYPASEAVKFLCDEFNHHKLKPCVARVGDGTHWWLEDIDNGNIIDPTAKQFNDNNKVIKLHQLGKGCGFLTKDPSKRARRLIDNAKTHLDI